MGVKKGFYNSKKYDAKVKLYYPADHAKTKEIIYYVTFKKTDGKKKKFLWERSLMGGTKRELLSKELS